MLFSAVLFDSKRMRKIFLVGPSSELVEKLLIAEQQKKKNDRKKEKRKKRCFINKSCLCSHSFLPFCNEPIYKNYF